MRMRDPRRDASELKRARAGASESIQHAKTPVRLVRPSARLLAHIRTPTTRRPLSLVLCASSVPSVAILAPCRIRGHIAYGHNME